MSPGTIMQLLDIYTLPDPEINQAIVKELASMHLIRYAMKDMKKFEVTDRGTAFVLLLCETPLPIEKWVDPRKCK